MGHKRGKAEKIAAILGASYIVLDVIARIYKGISVYDNEPDEKNPFEGKKVRFIADDSDIQNADGECGHLEKTGDAIHIPSFYEHYVKRGIDKTLSFAGLVSLAPMMGLISLVIEIEDPGPVLFTQKRVGQNKQYFRLHKFRSMKMSTPHDIPTHMLENPDQYITKVGAFLRKHSLDELPQIWDIFIGNMSIVGPRPALWNQDVLVAERDRYGANDIRPGLTGWAQINGRDELSIQDKAKLDGEYTSHLGFAIDMKCFLSSLGVIANDDTVVEGGTGSFANRTGVLADDPPENFGCDYEYSVAHDAHKKVLVVGKSSYLGRYFTAYAKHYYGDNFSIKAVSARPGRELDQMTDEELKSFDIVYYLSGIAHSDTGHADASEYYQVNTDLALSVAARCKKAGVHAFIYMSSMIVYGFQESVTRDSVPSPVNFYGDSKWQADKGIRSLADDSFRVIVIRPPMIYGRRSKGNYPKLAKIAKTLPVFPIVRNQRSMLYVENLCEFLCQLMLSDAADKAESLVFMPQNHEYTNTSEMVHMIADAHHHSIRKSKSLSAFVSLVEKLPGSIGKLADKAFGDSVYDMDLSIYEGLKYQKYGLRKSVERTEKSR